MLFPFVFLFIQLSALNIAYLAFLVGAGKTVVLEIMRTVKSWLTRFQR